MAADPWTDADTTRLRQLHSAGKSLHAIAAEMGRAKSTIHRKAKEAGLTFDRDTVAAATEAKMTDAKARRTALQLALLEDAEKLRTQLWEPCLAFNFGGKDNTYAEHHLDKPTFTDQLKIMQATGVAVDRSLKLAEHDSDGAEQVRSLLGGIAEALGLGTDHDA
jgi:hypothetical protein